MTEIPILSGDLLVKVDGLIRQKRADWMHYVMHTGQT